MAATSRTAPRASKPFPLTLTPAARRGVVLTRTVLAALGLLAGAPAMAQQWCTTEGPSVVVSDQRTSSCYLNNNGSTLTVEEGGSIIANGNTSVISSGTDSIVNKGRIAASNAMMSALAANGGTTVLLLNAVTGQIEGGTAIVNSSNSTINRLENQGRLIGNGTAVFNMGGMIKTLVNSGTIERSVTAGSGRTINNTGTMEQLTNEASGKITQNGTGDVIYNTGSIMKLVNKGEISGGTALHNLGFIEEFVNTGSLIAPEGEDAIFNEDQINTIRNAGLIQGGVGLNGAVLHIDGDNARMTGQVSGKAGSAVIVNGNFTTENNFSVDRFEVAQGGKLRFGGNHFVKTREGVFQNNGVVTVPAGVVADISGDYIQSSTGQLAIEAMSASNYGKVEIRGSAIFEANSKLLISVGESATLANQDVLADVVKAGSLETVQGFLVEDNSELFNFQAAVKGNSIELLTVLDDGSDPDNGQGGTDTGGSTPPASNGGAVSKRVNAQGFGQGMGAAGVLDGFVSGTSNTGDMANIVTALGRLGSQEEVAGAVAQTLPLMSANLNQVVIGGMQGVNRVIQGRLDGVGGFSGMSSGDGYLADRHLWFKPLASFADQDDRDGIAGYRSNTYGFVFGGDAVVGQASRLGLAFSYARSNVDGKSTARTNRADIDAYQLIAYGSHSFASLPDVEVNWQADVGLNQNDGRRVINFGGLDRTAKSDFDSTTAHFGAGISRGFQLSDKTRFTPSIRSDYFRIRNASYTESGADGLSLSVRSQTSEQWFAMLEGRLQHQLNDRLAVSANLGAGYEMLGESNGITASYVGGGAAFRTPGMAPGRWLGRAGLGLAMHANDRTEITARYDLEGRSGFTAQTASVNVRWSF